MGRPCFCSLAGSRASSLCQVHAFWPLIRRRVDPGYPLVSSVNRRNSNRIIRAFYQKFRSLLLNATAPMDSAWVRRRNLRSPAPPSAVVASSGIWHSPAFRGYIDMPRDVELGAQQLFDVDLDSDSADGEEPVHFGFEPRKPPRRAASRSFWASGFPESARMELIS